MLGYSSNTYVLEVSTILEGDTKGSHPLKCMCVCGGGGGGGNTP